MSAILSFLGGSAFRAVLGEISSFLTKRQDHKRELQSMELQGRLEAAQHARNLESLKVQAELGVKEIRVQADANALKADADAFTAAMARADKPSGIRWIDGWNGSVRPAFATMTLFLWVLSMHQADWVLTAWTLDLMGSVAGFFFADRTLRKRGK